jgi:hypothetical protein
LNCSERRHCLDTASTDHRCAEIECVLELLAAAVGV